MHGNINFVWNKIKDKEKFPHVFHKQLYLHGIFPSIERKKTQINRGILVVVGGSNPTCATPFISMHPDNIRIEYNRIFISFNFLQNELIFNESSKCARIYKVHGLENIFYPEFRGPVT